MTNRNTEIEKNGYPFKFSIIIAVYKVEEFIEETIESVISQSIGFEENIQLILVDDGSPDASGEICDKFQEKYPENILVIHKRNGGVSSARNEGLKHVNGEYVNFLDSDDKISENTLEEVYQFFSENKGTIDLVTIPLVYFDGRSGEHVLNNKFRKGARIIYLREEYNYPLLSLSASFITAAAAKMVHFDERLSIAEDAKEVTLILLRKMSYGVLPTATYWYRRRSEGTASATQQSVYDKRWYINYIDYFTNWLLDYCSENYQYIPQFVQYLLMYHLQWHLLTRNIPEQVLTEEEESYFKKQLSHALSRIDDKIILEQKSIYTEQKAYALTLKYSGAPDSQILADDVQFFFQNTFVGKMSSMITRIDFITIQENDLFVEGHMFSFGFQNKEETKIYLDINGERVLCSPNGHYINEYSLNEEIYTGIGFSVHAVLPEHQDVELSVLCEYKGVPIKKTNLRFGRFAPITTALKNAYCCMGKRVLRYNDGKMYVQALKKREIMINELRLIKEICTTHKVGSKKALINRCLYQIFPKNMFKNVWLLSDRVNKADDNGEAVFKYAAGLKGSKIKPVFAISKESPDFARLKAYGTVIPFGGWLYKLLFIFGAKIVSSQGDHFIHYPFGDYSYFYADIVSKRKFVFLQHGITKDDVSKWLNKYNQNINMFVTATKPEYDSILNGAYFYSSDVVKLTGFPRHDFLYHDEKKVITFMPTWRAYLVTGVEATTGLRKIRPGFENSAYFKMYTELLTDKTFIEKVKSLGYGIQFLLHPNMLDSRSQMVFDDYVTFLSPEEAYRKIFAESDLMITDYSSVASDFAYLRKPVLYYQADSEEFFSGAHTYSKGYFEYERDGFGEVEYDVNSMAERIIEYLENGCVLKEKYVKRINDTFPFDDNKNCQRVYEAIQQIK